MNKLASTARLQTACKLLMAWALLSLGVPIHAEQFGNMRFDVPAGWTSKKSGDALFLVPPNLATDQAALLVLSPGLDLRDFNTQFELLMKKTQGQRSVVEVGKLISTPSRDGHNVLRRELVLRESSGATLHMLVAAANANQRFESMHFAANSPALFAKLAPQVQSLLNATTFSAAQRAPAPQPSTNAAATDTPRMNSAPQVAFTDPKSRAKGEANLNPPPPGRARLNGLYATQETGGHVGPGGLIYQDFNWRFYYFLPNGYVYLGSKDAGLEDQNCTQPTVNKYGDPVCTTYAADNDQLRIGMRNPVRLRHKGNDLLIGDYEFAFIPPANNLRLNGTYGSYSAGTAAASGSGITFSRDGRFTSSNFVGVAIDTGQGGQPSGGSRVTVSGSSNSNAEGSYRINGYTLELNYSNGHKARAFFAQVAGTEAVRIGSRVYTRSGAK
jgi:hypothetical protein